MLTCSAALEDRVLLRRKGNCPALEPSTFAIPSWFGCRAQLSNTGSHCYLNTGSSEAVEMLSKDAPDAVMKLSNWRRACRRSHRRRSEQLLLHRRTATSAASSSCGRLSHLPPAASASSPSSQKSREFVWPLHQASATIVCMPYCTCPLSVHANRCTASMFEAC